MPAEWTNRVVDYENTENAQVKVKVLHWEATLTVDEDTVRVYGTTPDSEDRVYTLPALSNVPDSVRAGWVLAALGPDEVARTEELLETKMNQIKNPTSGTLEF